MITIALVGADGAGKTTVAKQVAARSGGRIRYLYMGMNAQSNKFALPTSRIALAVKRRAHGAKQPDRSGHAEEAVDLGHVKPPPNLILDSLRLLNRLAEEWFRLAIVMRIHRSGAMVISDRHFVLDHALKLLMGGENTGQMTDRLHRWTLHRFYPRPDLIIFLDAPAELLYERKRDAPLEYLLKRQDEYRRAAKTLPGFVAVDATCELDEVTASVEQEIDRFIAKTDQALGADQ